MSRMKRSVFLLTMILPVLAGCAKGGTIRLTGMEEDEWVAAYCISYEAYTNNEADIEADYEAAHTATSSGSGYDGKYWSVFQGQKAWSFDEDGAYWISAKGATSGKSVNRKFPLTGGEEVTVTLE